ncbi:hypothetical protein K466DRAFT_601533 [Polyporus arcularius HHB13444]|uniref:F-box domain-containing protein n=1 Tax=Polyporus arcularius HHB13444 TaxID=1314778 RepID=A0A5C3P5S0_9APHY|nr:hypothetical protein K466DRAFT_601533 [Polyporus arcularius HHB13444]
MATFQDPQPQVRLACFNDMLDSLCHVALEAPPSHGRLPLTLNPHAVTLPAHVYIRIADSLPYADASRFASVSRAAHDAATTVLYHDIFFTDKTMLRALQCLASNADRATTGQKRVHPTSKVRTITYITNDPDLDRVALPFLSIVLEHAAGLQYIALDFHEASLPLARRLLRRSGVHRNQPSPVLTHWYPHDKRYNQCKLSAPALSCIRTSHPEILEDICAFRALKTILFNDGRSEMEDVHTFIAAYRNYPGRFVLETFAYCTAIEDEPMLLTIVADIFPNLRHVCISLHIRNVFITPHSRRLHTLILTHLASHPHHLIDLHSLSIRPFRYRGLHPVLTTIAILRPYEIPGIPHLFSPPPFCVYQIYDEDNQNENHIAHHEHQVIIEDEDDM